LIDKATKERIVSFLGDLDDKKLTDPQRLEATALYNLLTRKPGRQTGWRKPAKVDTDMHETNLMITGPLPMKEDQEIGE
jgi:hypothetical protein